MERQANNSERAVDQIEFWQKRIKEAKKGYEFESVYVTTVSAWERIYEIHKAIIEEIVKGKVLDAGCGYGRMSTLFKNYVGVDFSPDFIKLAKSKYPNKEFLVASLESLSFKNKEFDWAVVVSVRDMIKNYQSRESWVAMEKELKRVAKKVLILEYVEPERYFIL